MRDNRVLFIVLALILLSCCCFALLVAGLVITRGMRLGTDFVQSTVNEVTETSDSEFPVTGPVTLGIDVPVGDIEIRGGEGNQVTVQVTKRAWGINQPAARDILNRMDVSVQQTSDTVQITASGPAWTGNPNRTRTPQVDLVITVPNQTSLKTKVGVGRLSVTGLRGDADINADVGEVTLTDVVPLSSLRVQTRVASVTLDAPLAENAAYDMTSDVGRIALKLPKDSAFAIDARSDIGDMQVGFEVSGSSSREGFVGKEVVGEVGSSPTTKLTLRSRVGDIRVDPQ
jgi:hypothetical protein